MDKEKDKPIKCNGCLQMPWCWEDVWENGNEPWCKKSEVEQ